MQLGKWAEEMRRQEKLFNQTLLQKNLRSLPRPRLAPQSAFQSRLLSLLRRLSACSCQTQWSARASFPSRYLENSTFIFTFPCFLPSTEGRTTFSSVSTWFSFAVSKVVTFLIVNVYKNKLWLSYFNVIKLTSAGSSFSWISTWLSVSGLKLSISDEIFSRAISKSLARKVSGLSYTFSFG